MPINLQEIREHLGRPPLLFAPSIEDLAARYQGRDIAIVGSGPSAHRSLEKLDAAIWTVGSAWIQHRTADLAIMMDDLRGPAWDGIRVVIHGQREDSTREEWEEVWRTCPVPILTSKAYPDLPQTVEYPLHEILSAFGRTYFAESVAFAIAWAIYIKVASISFFGCDYDGARPAERAGCEYWIGRAEAAGIKIRIGSGSQLLQTGPIDHKNRHIPGLYGYTNFDLRPFAGHELADFPEVAGGEGANLGDQALALLLRQKSIKTVLDIGCGAGLHAKHLADAGKQVTAIDKIAKDDYYEPFNGGSALVLPFDFLDPMCSFGERFDAIWTCHVLEHVDNPHEFLVKCFENLAEGGTLAITVPPAQHAVVGGHFTLWNAGILLYHLIRAGFDCREAKIKQYGYNLSILVKKPSYSFTQIDDANFSIERHKHLLPSSLVFSYGAFNGDIRELNWE